VINLALNIGRLEEEYRQKHIPAPRTPKALTEAINHLDTELASLKAKIVSVQETAEGLDAEFSKIEPLRLLSVMQQDITAILSALNNFEDLSVKLGANVDAEAELIAAAQAKLRSL
jgi:prefoldin subunit 5